MSERDDALMKQLAEVARAEREGDATEHPDAASLAAPFRADELDAITARASAAMEGGGARVVPIHAARRRWTWVAAPLATAALIALFVAKPWSSTGSALAPDYELVAEGNAQGTRSDPLPAAGAPMRIDRGGALTLVLRPRAPGSGPIGVRAFLEHDGALADWAVVPRISDEKAVRIDVDAATIARLPAGPSRIVIFVGHPSSLPSDAAHAKEAWTRPEGARVLVQDIVVAP